MAVNGSPRVSVTLPCYNSAATLDAALQSILDQTFTDFELIVVNDGSTDRTTELLENWQRRDPRIVTHEIEHGGVALAQNCATALARGEYVARMDADDISLPDRLAKQVAHLDAHPEISATSTQIEFFPAAEVREGTRRYQEWVNSLTTPDDIERDLFVECPIPHPTIMHRRQVLDQVRGYRQTEWPEDYELVLRLRHHGHRIGKVPEILLQWREHPDRITHTDARYSEAAFRACKVHYIGDRIRGKPVVVWGSGPVGKLFARALQNAGHTIAAFVDLDPRKIGQEIHGAPVIHPENIEQFRAAYFLAAVGSHQARAEIRQTLVSSGFVEIRDWCAVA